MRSVLRLSWVSLILLMAALILLPFHLLALLFKDRAARFAPFIWHKVACWSIGLKVIRKGKLSSNKHLMIVANHSSWLDIIVLGSISPLAFIAKSEVKTWPVFGLLAQLQRTIFIDRNNRRQTGHQVSTIGKRIRKGDIVVLFPEGTTSDGNYILPFKSALFGAAQRAQNDLPEHELAVQPVSIAYVSAHGIPLGRANRDLTSWPGDVELLPHLKNIILEGALGVEITFGDPIIFTEEMRRSEIAKQCETDIRRNLNASLRK